MKPIIIIGSGLAGYTLLRELRRLDTLTPVILITRDEGSFYYKPLLADALSRKRPSEGLSVATAIHMEQQFQAEIITRTQVLSIDHAAKRVLTAGRSLDYFKLVLAVGARPIRPPLSGDAALELLTVNDLAGYELFRNTIRGRERVAILGAGMVGCEFANDLRNAGYGVDVVEPFPWPLGHLLPEAAARPLRTALAQRGVGWHCGTRALTLESADSHYRLTLSNGSRLEVDAVLSAAGLKPRTDLATAAGLAVDKGIRVDRFLQTNRDAIYALGDCAQLGGQLMHHVTSIQYAARALAKTLAGRLTPLNLPVMPITLKTPAHPLVLVPPPDPQEGQWQCQPAGDGVRALFLDPTDRLAGFALSGQAVKEQAALVRRMQG